MGYIVLGILACLIPGLLFMLASWLDGVLYRRSQERQLAEYLRRLGDG
jgi:hypothetical protein